MKLATVALALHTELDVAAVRRLHDYGALDDANVTRAYEHLCMQRSGRRDWPAHLRCITHLAAVIDSGEDVRLLCLDARDDEEAAALRELFAYWPSGDGRIVVWHEDDAALLDVRTFLHACPAAAGLSDWPRVALADHIDFSGFASARDADALEAEIARLLDTPLPDMTTGQRTKTIAVNRYRWWLRWQYSQGVIDADERTRREAALAGGEEARTAES